VLIEKEKLAVPVLPAPTDGEQPLYKRSEQSIVEGNFENNPPEKNYEEMLRMMQLMNVPTEQFADCTVDRQRKSPRFFSASDSNVFRKIGCCPCRDLQSGSPLANIGRGFRRSRILALCPQAAHGTLQPVRMKVS